jgi:hypothetical protein
MQEPVNTSKCVDCKQFITDDSSHFIKKNSTTREYLNVKHKFTVSTHPSGQNNMHINREMAENPVL